MNFIKKTFWVDKSTGDIKKTMAKKKYKVMLVSGGFDPVHKGHLEMIEQARKQADEVWVILNNDNS